MVVVEVASIWMLAPAQNTLSSPLVSTTAFTSRVLEAEALDRVVQLDVDPEVVGVQLQLVVGAQPAIGLHLHPQCGDVADDVEPPVLVCGRLPVEVRERDDRIDFVHRPSSLL